jgi:hypothetical protein
LSAPWADNITTFADALKSSMPNPPNPMPSVMQVVNRCWCDLSSGNFFEPFSVSEWEHISIRRVVSELENNAKIAEEKQRALEVSDDTGATTSEANPSTTSEFASTNVTHVEEPKVTLVPSRPPASKGWLSTLFDCHSSLPTPSPLGIPSKDHITRTPPYIPPKEKLPLLRREYDLRQYGLDMIIDFGWSRESS